MIKMLSVAGIANLLRVGVWKQESVDLSRAANAIRLAIPTQLGSPRHGTPLAGASLPELPFAGEHRRYRTRSAPSPVGKRSRPGPTSGRFFCRGGCYEVPPPEPPLPPPDVPPIGGHAGGGV